MHSNRSIAILVASLSLSMYAAPSHALCDARWYDGLWNCKIATRPMTIRFYKDGASECSTSAVSTTSTGVKVNMQLRTGNANEVSIVDEGGSVFVLRPKPAGSKDDAEGTATIENIADPLVCAKHPLKPGRVRDFYEVTPRYLRKIRPGQL